MASDATVSVVTSDPNSPSVASASFAELSLHQLYAVLQLRVDVFVVEQQCPYAELDGLDTDPGAEHFWIEAGIPGKVVATLRVLQVDGRPRIGRVATAWSHRQRGYAAALMRAALAHVGEREITLEAQSHLQQWYAGFGFVRSGEDYDEDGIRHVHMRREPQA